MSTVWEKCIAFLMLERLKSIVMTVLSMVEYLSPVEFSLVVATAQAHTYFSEEQNSD
jgi:hypothetical protein